MIGVDGIALDVRWKHSVFAKLIMWNLTLGTATVIHAGHKSLLRVVADIRSQDWVAVAPDSIRAHHSHAHFFTGSDRSQNTFHTRMEQIS